MESFDGTTTSLYRNHGRKNASVTVHAREDVSQKRARISDTSYEPSYLVICLFMRAVYYCFALQILDRRSGTTLFIFTLDLLLSGWPFAVGFSLFLQIAREALLFYYPKNMPFEPENLLFTTVAFLVSTIYCMCQKKSSVKNSKIN